MVPLSLSLPCPQTKLELMKWYKRPKVWGYKHTYTCLPHKFLILSVYNWKILFIRLFKKNKPKICYDAMKCLMHDLYNGMEQNWSLLHPESFLPKIVLEFSFHSFDWKEKLKWNDYSFFFVFGKIIINITKYDLNTLAT